MDPETRSPAHAAGLFRGRLHAARRGRAIAGRLADQSGVERAPAQCDAVTLTQRFGSAPKLIVHFHMPWLEGYGAASGVGEGHGWLYPAPGLPRR